MRFKTSIQGEYLLLTKILTLDSDKWGCFFVNKLLLK